MRRCWTPSLSKGRFRRYYLGRPRFSYGSGKSLLDNYVTNDFSQRMKQLQEYLIGKEKRDKQLVRAITPYFLCLWLSELTLSFDASKLEEKGVGGAFHFVYQTEALEASQDPALYIFSAADRSERTIYSWSYRVAYVQGGLYVEKHAPPNQNGNSPVASVRRNAFFDVTSTPNVVAISQDVLRKQIESELAGLPFYKFCGFGFTPPPNRKSFGFIVSSEGKREDIFDNAGRLQSPIQTMIISNFER